MKTLAAALAVVLSVLPPRALAWSAHGHEAVGAVAQKLLSPDARRAVSQILGAGVTLDQIAPCADDIRHGNRGFNCAGLWLNAEPESQPWHFINVPNTASPSAPSGLERFCPGGNCVVDQIRAEVEQLKSADKASDKQVALMFLVHFVGDVHQPLHCATGLYNGSDDRGGNSEPVSWGGGAASFGKLTLHSLWDHIIQPSDSFDPKALADELASSLPGDASSWTSGDFVGQAALESFQIAKDQIYPAYDRTSGRVDSSYVAQMQPIAKRRIQMAGVRLAALIESALAGGNSVASAPAPANGERMTKPRKKVAVELASALPW